MNINIKLVIFSLIFIILFGVVSIAEENPGISDVLIKPDAASSSNVKTENSSVFLFGLLVLVVGAVAFGGYTRLKSNKSREQDDAIAMVQVGNMNKDKGNNSNQEMFLEMQKQNEILKAEKKMFQEKIRKYEESMRNFMNTENTLKKSSQVLQAKYEKILAEKEGLVLEVRSSNAELKPQKAAKRALRAKKTSSRKRKNKKG
ncbi:MAG: hypothetical protein ABIA63_05475 [bacterium]